MGSPSLLFRINVDGTLSNLNGQLDKITPCLKHYDKRVLVNVKYLHPSDDDDIHVSFHQHTTSK